MPQHNSVKIRNLIPLALPLLICLAGCGRSWEATIVAPDGSSYAVNGKVLEGLDVVDAIATTKIDKSNKPLEDVVIKNVRVTSIKPH